VVGLLLEYGVDVDARDGKGGTPLHHAAEEEHTKVARLLLEYGADVNARNNTGSTPLHSAARSGRVSLVEPFPSLGCVSA
jgi:ankyrin repeat protein